MSYSLNVDVEYSIKSFSSFLYKEKEGEEKLENILEIKLSNRWKNIRFNPIPNNINKLSIEGEPLDNKVSQPIESFPDMSKVNDLDELSLDRLEFSKDLHIPFPNTLKMLHISRTEITLTTLPDSITDLSLTEMDLEYIPSHLPSNLEYLNVGNNFLKSLPPLPKTLVLLNAENNTLESLPPLPNNLNYLNIKHNKLTTLGAVPPKLHDTNIQCAYNEADCREMVKLGRMMWKLQEKIQANLTVKQGIEAAKIIASKLDLPPELSQRIVFEGYRSKLCDPENINNVSYQKIVSLANYFNVPPQNTKEETCKAVYDKISTMPFAGPIAKEEDIILPPPADEMEGDVDTESIYEY